MYFATGEFVLLCGIFLNFLGLIREGILLRGVSFLWGWWTNVKTRLCSDAFLLAPRFVISTLRLATENRGTARTTPFVCFREACWSCRRQLPKSHKTQVTIELRSSQQKWKWGKSEHICSGGMFHIFRDFSRDVLKSVQCGITEVINETLSAVWWSSIASFYYRSVLQWLLWPIKSSFFLGWGVLVPYRKM